MTDRQLRHVPPQTCGGSVLLTNEPAKCRRSLTSRGRDEPPWPATRHSTLARRPLCCKRRNTWLGVPGDATISVIVLDYQRLQAGVDYHTIWKASRRRQPP